MDWLTDVIGQISFISEGQLDHLLPHNWLKNQNIPKIEIAI